MKKLYILIPALLLSMVSCTVTPSNSGTNSSNESNSQISSSSQTNKNEWSNEEKELMNECLNCLLPFYNFPNYKMEKFEDDGAYIVLSSSSEEDFSDEYSSLLTSNGWTLDSSTTFTGFSKYEEEDGYIVDGSLSDEFTLVNMQFINDDNVLVDYIYSPKSGIYLDGETYYLADAGNTITACIYEGEGGGDNQGELTSWPTSNIVSLFGVDIPHFEASTYNFYDLSEYNSGVYIYCYDYNYSNAEESYKTILENNNYVVTYDEDEQIYNATKDNNLFGIGFYEDTTGFIITIYDVVLPSTWPNDKINNYYGEEVNVPSVIDTDTYYFYDYDQPYLTFETTDESLLQSYKTKLENDNWVVEYVPSNIVDEVEKGNYYQATKEEVHASLIYYIDNGNFVIGFDKLVSLSSWPTDKINNLFGVNVPSVDGINEYYVDDSDIDNYGLQIYFESSDNALIESYKQTLTNAGFTTSYDSEYYDCDIAYDKDNKIFILWYIEEGYFNVQIFTADEDVEQGDYTFNFSNENQLSSKGDNTSTWKEGNFSMVVNKGTSNVTVGNVSPGKSYYSNPLRIYEGQNVKISWTNENVSSIVLYVNMNNSKSSPTTISNVKGATLSISGNKAIFVVDNNSTSVTFEIVNASVGEDKITQCHLDGIEFVK